MLTESSLFIILVAGIAVVAAGYVWMIIRAFGTSVGWGICTLLPVAGLLYPIMHFRRARWPLAVMVIGGLISATPYALTKLILAPKVAVTHEQGGEKSVTLTEATDTDVSAYLRANRDATVLQMANRKDVTDETLKLLADMPNLRELDINDTTITDEGLATLASLPKLQSLRIARTKITAAGVQTRLLSLPGLKQIDVSGLAIPGKVLREWKNADPEHRKYVN